MSYKVPLFDLNFDEKEELAVQNVIRSKWISTGPKCLEFEQTFASMFRAKHAVSLSNCTVALHLAMKLLNIQDGDEVICPSLTFVATVNCIRYVNATPVFADVTSTSDLNIDPAEIERLITPKTRAIIVMHYGGFPCQMDRIMEIARKHNIPVVEDACHGPLSEYKGQKLGTIGDIGCFSFFSNKNISTGEGGMLITNNDEYAAKAKLLRSHGMTTMSYQRASGHSTEYDVVEAGFNYRMDDIHAAIGIVQLQKIQEDLEQRILHRKQYLSLLSNNTKLIIPFADCNEFVSNYIFPVVLKGYGKDRRNEMRTKLHEMGVQTSVHYPAVHRFSIFERYARPLPMTEDATDNELTLPMYGKLSEEDIAYVCECVNKVIQ